MIMNRRSILALLFMLPALASCEPEKPMDHTPAPMPKVPAGDEVVTLGAGCFWCVEAVFKQIDGVASVTSGYMGGKVKNPTYQQVCEENTGHAEVVQIVYDPKKVSLEKILDWFWKLHDPTTLNRQGNDVGTQYRSAIFYHTDAQKTAAEAAKKAAQKDFTDPIVTEITKAGDFWPAENYHQDYYFQNKNKNGYCRVVIEPKLKKLKLDH
ncbi:peptide-methionine (S)-S-oxide reductase MsrA [Luteolibacter ambystomatis]|uniref:Peptide methionine sulfoxide reductase MsrA n=2 Tax=Luteolibacter ambystomatis TaxID=2824561 RepID=A0A975G738_9BACT|nr:peptide-methionine (S)-S-oxide reductase MsrA [Luteolibacter ambystomatis]